MTKRTNQQNRALHKYFSELADCLNDAGLTVQATLEPTMEINWTATMIKEILWRTTQRIMLDKVSTTELETGEVTKVYEELNRFLAEKHGKHVPFPSLEEIMMRNIEPN